MPAVGSTRLSLLLVMSFFGWCTGIVETTSETSTTETSTTETSTTETSTTESSTTESSSTRTSTMSQTTTPHTATSSSDTSTFSETSNTETSTTTRTRGFECQDDPATFETDYGDCSTYAPNREYHYYCEEDFDEHGIFSAQQVCPQCRSCIFAGNDASNASFFECNASSFDAGFGNCSTYAEGLENHIYCREDQLNGTYAVEVCMECGQCYVTTETETSTTMETTARTVTMTSTTADARPEISNEDDLDEVSAATQRSCVAMAFSSMLSVALA